MEYEKFMKEALKQAKAALKKGEFPVGCVIVYNNKVIAKGHRINTNANEIDHAEMVALKNLGALKKRNHPSQMTLFCTMEPCLMCFGAILISGIGKIIYAYEDVMGGATQTDLSTASSLYQERKVIVVPNVLRSQSLEFFKIYFNNPENKYWKESPLARYTLDQE